MEISTPAEDVATAETTESPQEEQKSHIPPMWILAILCIGLLMAAIYLGARIVTGHRSSAKATASIVSVPPQPKPSAPQASTVPATATPAPVTSTTPAIEAKPDSNENLPMITPQSGERYLQVAALDPPSTLRFVEHLRRQNFDPRVAPGPRPELRRVLIGPFDNRDTLNEKKAQLQDQGLDPFIREY